MKKTTLPPDSGGVAKQQQHNNSTCEQIQKIQDQNNTIKRLPYQLQQQALARANERFTSYSVACSFFMQRTKRLIKMAKSYIDIQKEYDSRIDDLVKESRQCEQSANEYRELLKLSLQEIIQLEQGGHYER